MPTNDPTARIRALFEERASDGATPAWLAAAREQSLERFLAKGFPTTRDEEWRFTNVAPIAEHPFALPVSGDGGDAEPLRTELALGRSAGLDCHELVFVNGRLDTSMSELGALPDGVIVSSVAEALRTHPDTLQAVLEGHRSDDTPFRALNTAFAVDGGFIHVPPGVVLERPVHLVFLSTPSSGEVSFASHPVNVIAADRGSELRVIETYAGTAGSVYWNNVATEIVAGDGAVVDHYKLQLESTEAFHTASLHFAQGRSANVSNHSLSIGGRLARHDIQASLDGEGADVTLNGLYVVDGRQHVDHHTVIDHRVPHCTSRELYKGVLDGASLGVFNGRVIVRADAQKTDSQQSNKNLLLSRDALVHTNPQLEINADDVKCAHGATIGQLDEDMLFYLRSRGIGLERARAILTEGFIADVSDRVRVEALRKALKQRLFTELAA